MNLYRVLDANLNRVSEGIRVLEDIARYVTEDGESVDKLRHLRHEVRIGFRSPDLLEARNASGDIGYAAALKNELDSRESLKSLVESNFKRMQEGLRSIEECLKIIGQYPQAKIYEGLRYRSYDIEKNYRMLCFPADADLYGITGEHFSKGRSTLETVAEMLAAGIRIIQYREKKKSKGEKYRDCTQLKEMTKAAGALFIVNDDVDIAIAVKADGVHIGQEDMPPREVRKLVGPMLLGLSTHNREQALAAVEAGVDYIGVGPVFATQTKENPEPSEGLSYLEWVSRNITLPYVAIGGITEDNIALAKEKGGRCFAMISEIVGAADIKGKVKALRRRIGNGLEQAARSK